MSTYSDLAESAAFLAGRDAARAFRAEGVIVTDDDGHRWCPRGLHADDEAAWHRGWGSAWT